MSCLKAVDKVKPWFTSTKRSERSLIVTCMLEALRARTMNLDYNSGAGKEGGGGGLGGGVGKLKMTDMDYWRGHDMTTSNISNSGM